MKPPIAIARLTLALAALLLGLISWFRHVPHRVLADLPSRLASYSNPALPLAPGLVPRLLQFLALLTPPAAGPAPR